MERIFDENYQRSVSPPPMAAPPQQPPPDEEDNGLGVGHYFDLYEDEARSVSPPLIAVPQQQNYSPPPYEIAPAYFERYALRLQGSEESSNEQSNASSLSIDDESLDGDFEENGNDGEEADPQNVDQLLDHPENDNNEFVQHNDQESMDSSSSDSEALESLVSEDDEPLDDELEENEDEEITRIANTLFPRDMEIENDVDENEEYNDITHQQLIDLDRDSFLKITATGKLDGHCYRRKFEWNDRRNIENYTTKSDIDSISVIMEELDALRNSATVKVYPFPDKRFAVENSNGSKFRNRPVHHYRNFRIASVGAGNLFIHVVDDTRTNARGQTRNPGAIRTMTMQHVIDTMMEIITELNPLYVDMPATFKVAEYKNRRHNGNFIFPEFVITGCFFKRIMSLLSERVRELDYPLLRGGIFFHFLAKNLKGLLSTDTENPYDLHVDYLDEFMLENLQTYLVNWDINAVWFIFVIFLSSLMKIPRMLILDWYLLTIQIHQQRS